MCSAKTMMSQKSRIRKKNMLLSNFYDGEIV
jgi:hypothetical protein